MTGNNTLLLVVAGCVARELENLGSKVLKDGSKIDCAIHASQSRSVTRFRTLDKSRRTRSTRTHTLSVVALLQETVDTTDGELETRLRGAGLRLGGGITGGLARLGLAAALARHVA